MTIPFAVKDCALIAIATGEQAQNLRELKDRLAATHPGCIYYHFWGVLLRPNFNIPEYQNDFAAWAYQGLHDKTLAERFALIDPTDFDDMEALRRELIEVIDERLDDTDWIPWASANKQFHFMRSQIVVFDTGIKISEPEQLKDLISHFAVGSVFFHFIDARLRNQKRNDDFTEWLMCFGREYLPLTEKLGSVDPGFKSLVELRFQLAKVIQENLDT
jgi:hypothetical protein